jgi:tetratricopeptide (TPR) repeat protein
MNQVFISYQHDDGDFADVLIQKVKEAGFSTWIDNDQLQAGTDWREGIDHAIKESCALIVIMSPVAKASEYVTYEWAFAWGTGVKVIPVVYKQTPLHPRLETLHYLNFTSRIARPWEKLVESLKEAAQLSVVTLHVQTLHSEIAVQKTPDQWLETGDIMYELEEYEKALEAFEETLHLDPNNALVYKKKGDTLTKLNRYSDALISYEYALRLDPNSALAYYNKGNTLANLKRFKKALDAYEHALRLEPNNAKLYINKGYVLTCSKRYEEALAAYEKALHLDPNNADVYTNKGRSLHSLDRYEEALAAYEKALSLDPNNAEAHISKGKALIALNRNEEALAAYEQALSLDHYNSVASTYKRLLLGIINRNK